MNLPLSLRNVLYTRVDLVALCDVYGELIYRYNITKLELH